MQTFACVCGQRLFFENSQCLNCGRSVGWCPGCGTLTAIEPTNDGPGVYSCARADCRQRLRLCHNYVTYQACNRCVLADADPPAGTRDQPLCDMCRFNETIPDLSIAGNLEHWRRLEIAKRRVLWQLQVLELPPFGACGPGGMELSFDFMADAIPTGEGWRPMGAEQVYTGHANGKITINVREADPVEREKLRVTFGESHRTLVGHFRHELAHYLYDNCVANSAAAGAFAQVFGDPDNPPYDEALQRYYQSGPPANWPQQYISAYAAMHPLEDWAETTAGLLDAVAVVDTAYHMGHAQPDPATCPFPVLLRTFVDLGIFLNEVNRTMGLLDVAPDVFTPAVREKLEFVHGVLVAG